jgi:hypothetical protein
VTVAGRHHRFALLDVSYGGERLPSATLNRWEADDGTVQWNARVLVRATLEPVGLLVGRLADGRHLSGQARVVGDEPGPRSRGERIVEVRGTGQLEGWAPTAVTADPPQDAQRQREAEAPAAPAARAPAASA